MPVLIDWPNDSPTDRDEWERIIRDEYTQGAGTLSVRVSRAEGWGWRIEDAWDSTSATAARPLGGLNPVQSTLKDDYRDRLYRALKEAGKPVVE
jgi:hypothetical protein